MKNKILAALLAMALLAAMPIYGTAAGQPRLADCIELEWMRGSEAEADVMIRLATDDAEWAYGSIFEATPLRYFQSTGAQTAANTKAAAGEESVYAESGQKAGYENVWDCGENLSGEKSEMYYDWASWKHYGTGTDSHSIRRFSSYVELDAEQYYSLSDAMLAPEDELGVMSYLFPVNDNMFVFVNGRLAFCNADTAARAQTEKEYVFGGNNGLLTRSGENYIFNGLFPHTGGRCIDLEKYKDAVNIKSFLKLGENRIDIIFDEYNNGGGMNKLNLYCEYEQTTLPGNPAPVYTVFVVDATSSMGTADISGGLDDNQTRFALVRQSISNYLDAVYKAPYENVEKHFALVSFGNGARVHLSVNDAAGRFASLSTNHRGSFPGGPDEVHDHYIGAHDYGREQAEDALAKYNSITDKTALFYSSRSDIVAMVSQITAYADTNAESGLLLARDLLKAAPENSIRQIIFITDGESSSSSTFYSLYNNAGAGEKIAKSSLSANGESIVASYENINEKLTERDFGVIGKPITAGISSLSEGEVNTLKLRALSRNMDFYNLITKELAVNPFAGERHNFDEINGSEIIRVSGSPDFAREADLNGYYWSRGLIARESAAAYHQKSPYFKRNQGLWQFSNNNGKTSSNIYVDKIFAQSSAGRAIEHLSFNNSDTELMIFSSDEKVAGSRMIDYYESGPGNFYTSDAAKRFMIAAANKAKGDGIEILSVGVGGLVMLPEYLHKVDSHGNAQIIDSETIGPVNALIRRMLNFTNEGLMK